MSIQQLFRYKTALGGLLGVALAFILTVEIARAACDPNGDPNDANVSCSTSYMLTGAINAIAGRTNSVNAAYPALDQPMLPMAGALFYVDYKNLEAQARDLLNQNMKFREDISPYRGTNSFDKLVRQFDVNAGFTANYDDPDPQIGAMSLQQRIDQADAELRQARDLYAYLAVYAPEARMRNDAVYITDPTTGFPAPLCGASNKEDPDPPDPNHNGQVLDPVIDWCDFGARLRQSVREAAYLRMIFAQQFMVDALGLQFGGSLLGGEVFVRQEVAKLRAAQYQFELAETGLAEALGRPLGSGCAVSDFYTQAEWALISRAATGQQEAQHHIGIRLSYLDINTVDDAPRAQANAVDTFRSAQTAGYIKLVGTAGMTAQTPTTSCAKGTSPDSNLVAEMVVNLLETNAKARELRAGRNIFGFDLALTPARPYHTAFGSTDKGLWEQAKEAADYALQLQQQTEAAGRIFDLNQQDLANAIIAINNKVDYDIQKQAGCDLPAFQQEPDPSAAYYACVQTMIEETAKCDPTANTFDACMARTTDGQPAAVDCSNCLILVSDMRKTRQNLRVAWLGVEAALERRDNLKKRVNTETTRNKKVTSLILTGAKQVAVDEAFIVALNCCSVTVSKEGPELTTNPGAVAEAIARPLQMIKQAHNEMEIEDANSKALIDNLFLDIVEAYNEIEIAIQQYNAMLTEYNGVVGQTGHDMLESQRQHAYAIALPANDPSYRMVRDSLRLELAGQLKLAARLSYLAARRAEYEYTARLSGSNFRISDIYKARTANNILTFLQGLDGAIANLPGGVKDAEINQRDLTISVAQHVLGLTDTLLQSEGFTGAALQDERTQRLRQWIAQNTSVGSDGNAILTFDLAASADPRGLLSQVVQQGYDFYWLHKVAGIGQPKPANNGLGVNLLTTQPGNLGHRQVRVSQTGQAELISHAGCQFDYRLIPPALLLGLEYAANQPTDVATGVFNGDINGARGNSSPGFSTPAFLGRPLASNGWQVVIYAASPDGTSPVLDLQQLTDIELKVSTTYATRASNAPPQPSQCVRTDF